MAFARMNEIWVMLLDNQTKYFFSMEKQVHMMFGFESKH